MYAILKIQLRQMYYLSHLVHKLEVVVQEQVLRLEQRVRQQEHRRYMLELVLVNSGGLLVRQEEQVVRLVVVTAYLFLPFGMLLRIAEVLVVADQPAEPRTEEV
jgi:hypothetical protein